jgi:type II secretory pathway component PulF
MKRLNIYFWICTGLLVPAVGIGSALGVVPSEESTKVITTLGYPAYLLPYISVAKLVALVVIFIPKFPRLKEWAYAGLVIDITGAMYSILATSHSVSNLIFPLLALLLVFGSYYFYHRRIQLPATR